MRVFSAGTFPGLSLAAHDNSRDGAGPPPHTRTLILRMERLTSPLAVDEVREELKEIDKLLFPDVFGPKCTESCFRLPATR